MERRARGSGAENTEMSWAAAERGTPPPCAAREAWRRNSESSESWNSGDGEEAESRTGSQCAETASELMQARGDSEGNSSRIGGNPKGITRMK